MRTLVLVPTAREREVILASAPEVRELAVLCGFGPVAAAARTAALISERRPERVLLVGIAGTYDEAAFPVAGAARLAACTVDGIGAGAGASHLPAAALGFPHWPGDAATPRLDDRVEVDPAGSGLLVTVCAASASPEEATERRRRHPGALAEDMEGFGVAVACALAAVPLVLVRGASNRAGDRDVRAWRIGPALEAAAALLRTMLA